MALQSLIGLDHVVAVTRDLDAAAQTWRSLGFTVSPRGVHSPLLGTANHTIMFEHDYIELLGVLTETDYNAPSRAFLARAGEGIERVAFTARDAAAGANELRARGLEAVGPVAFGRPVDLPDGGQTEAKFRVFLWPENDRPGGIRLFACEHLTPEAVWLPSLLRHANTARRIARVAVVSPHAEAEAKHFARLIDAALAEDGRGGFRIATGESRAAFVFLSKEALAERNPGVPLDALPERGVAGLAIVVHDLGAAERAAGVNAVRVSSAVCVPPAAANGVLIRFESGS